MNVYVVGTMNTSDRSLTGIDVALRRRFHFLEILPKPEELRGVFVGGVDIEILLRTINQRIEIFLGRDHCLGHAYFMELINNPFFSCLQNIFRNKVIPLLQEYFFEDWNRIQWVLNDHRKNYEDRFIYNEKYDIQALLGDIDVPINRVGWRVNDSAFDRLSAYSGIISVP